MKRRRESRAKGDELTPQRPQPLFQLRRLARPARILKFFLSFPELLELREVLIKYEDFGEP